MTMTCDAPAAAARPTPYPGARGIAAAFKRHGRSLGAVVLSLVLIASAWTIPSELSHEARVCVIVLGLAIIGWTLTDLGDTAIALGACLALVASGVVRQGDLHGALGHELVWLLIGAFVMAAVLKASGLTEHLAFMLVRRLGTVRALFYGLTAMLVATALFVPSTSGRAALALPVFLALADKIGNPARVRALALLFPTVILLSAGGSLIGAGAHLIAVDFIRMLEGRTFDYLAWLMIGMPMALVVSFGATELVLRMFLSREDCAAPLGFTGLPKRDLTVQDGCLTGMVLATVMLWMTSAWHGFSIAIVTVAAALVMTAPGLSPLSLKKAMKSVEWDMLLFMAATLLIGEALLDTNADEWAGSRLVSLVGGASQASLGMIVLVVIGLSLAAHLVITSRTARVTVLIPTVIIPLAGFGLDPAALIMICVMGTGFCQTLAASAKPVALYAGLERETYAGSDLLKLSLALAPLMAMTLAVFGFLIWPWQGLSPWR